MLASPTFENVAGRLCLDFANTVSSYFATPRNEKLHSYERFLTFAQQAGAISAPSARALAAEARRRPEEAERVLAEARRLREVIFILFHGRAGGPRGGPGQLEVLNGFLAAALARQQVVGDNGVFRLAFERDDTALDSPLWPIAESAARLLVDSSARVRLCEGGPERCTWLFVDESKNHSRRWCSMKDCGNREKARRHYQREKTVS
jgi:predicted RNA-binding Zn ribbon-like protein